VTAPDRAGELADRLLARFGSFGAVMAAPTRQRASLLEDAEEVERMLCRVDGALDHILHGRMAAGPVLSEEQAVLDYLRNAMAFAPIEQARVLFLDAANHLLADEVLAAGTVDRVHVYPREILKRCIELGATAIILAHNHPSGRPRPSRADEDMTRHLVAAARPLGVTVHDHLLVARDGIVSFRRTGRL
jgi:DNA repair protein RadC